jgi:hypothetical protein
MEDAHKARLCCHLLPPANSFRCPSRRKRSKVDRRNSLRVLLDELNNLRRSNRTILDTKQFLRLLQRHGYVYTLQTTIAYGRRCRLNSVHGNLRDFGLFFLQASTRRTIRQFHLSRHQDVRGTSNKLLEQKVLGHQEWWQTVSSP